MNDLIGRASCGKECRSRLSPYHSAAEQPLAAATAATAEQSISEAALM